MYQCKFCKIVIHDEISAFCPNCGKNINKWCSRCGKWIAAAFMGSELDEADSSIDGPYATEQQFCTDCGTELQTKPPPHDL